MLDLKLHFVLNAEDLPQLLHQLLLVLIIAECGPGGCECCLCDVRLREAPGEKQLHLLHVPAARYDGGPGAEAPLHVVLRQLDHRVIVAGQRDTPRQQTEARAGHEVNLVYLAVVVQGGVLHVMVTVTLSQSESHLRHVVTEDYPVRLQLLQSLEHHLRGTELAGLD